MKVEMRNMKRRDGTVYVDIDPTPKKTEDTWLKDVGTIGIMLTGILVALAWFVVGG